MKTEPNNRPPEVTVKKLVSKIEKRMKELNVNQNQLSIMSGISRGQLNKYFKGTQEPGLGNLIKILDALDLEINFKKK